MLQILHTSALPLIKNLSKNSFKCKDTFRLFSDNSNYLTPLESSPEQVYAISGSSRGIGLEFSRQLLLRTNAKTVIGLSRTSTPGLLKLLEEFPDRFHICHVDLENQESVETAGAEVARIATRVDLLLNVAGILGDGGKTLPGIYTRITLLYSIAMYDIASYSICSLHRFILCIYSSIKGPERSILNIDREWFAKTLNLNLVGHVMMTKALVPLLKKDKASLPSKIVNLSARVGSITDNTLGGWYSYRISKTGLNMFTKTSSIEMKRYNSTLCINCINMHRIFVAIFSDTF